MRPSHHISKPKVPLIEHSSPLQKNKQIIMVCSLHSNNKKFHIQVKEASKLSVNWNLKKSIKWNLNEENETQDLIW